MLILLFVVACFVHLAATERQTYRTAYGCEGRTLTISCPEPGHVINVIRANYGRFSITICNEQGNTEWSVNCQSPRTHRVLSERCSGRETCSVLVSSDVFGNPCPGTYKYIELHYSCGLATTTTTSARPRPPWFLETRPSVHIPSSLNASLLIPTTPLSPVLWSSTTATTTTKVAVTLTTPLQSSTTPTTTSTTTEKTTLKQPIPVHQGDENNILFENKEVSSIETNDLPESVEGRRDGSSYTTVQSTILYSPPLNNLSSASVGPIVITTPVNLSSGVRTNDTIRWCAPSFGRGLYWNWTRWGELAIQACPAGASGSAKRKCSQGEWEGPADLSECRSAWLSALQARASGPDSVLGVITDLKKVTSSKALYGGDLTTASKLISVLSQRMAQDLSSFPNQKQKQSLIFEFLQAALETGSALLASGMAGPWGDLSVRERRHAVTQLMIGLEEAAFLLGDSLTHTSESAYFKSHVFASARAVSPDGAPVHFPSLNDESLEWVFTDSVTIPPEAVLENSEDGTTHVVFLTYRHLEDLLSPQEDALEGLRSNRNITRIVNSRVVSASLGHGKHIQLPGPVKLTFSLLKQENVSNPVCVFWDYTTLSWSDEGCKVSYQNKSHVMCRCNHLTNFAVIMDEVASLIDSIDSPLQILTFISCIICILCLVFSAAGLAICRKYGPSKMGTHLHICVCLLVAELVFLLFIWRTDLPIVCGFAAGLLHYLILSAFIWVFLEGVQVYTGVAKSEQSGEVPHLRWWHFVLAYGGPFVVVGVSLLVDPFSFGTDNHCWLRSDNYFVFALVIPVLVLVAVSLALLGASLVHTCKLNPDDTLKAKEIASLSAARSAIVSTTVLLCLMVFTWALALLLLSQPCLQFAVAFLILNTLQGVFFLYLYCFRDRKVQDWCSSSEGQAATRIPHLFRNVFPTEKQTYSPSNNNITTSTHPSQNTVHSSHQHQVISKAVNQALSGPAVQQYLPTLYHLGGLKGSRPKIQSQHGTLLTGDISMMGSRGSLRQVNGPIHRGSFHQSLPRHHMISHPPSAHITGINVTNLTPALPSGPTDEESSYKSFSRDSGNGGSEQEDSPRVMWNGNSQQNRFTHSLNNELKQCYVTKLNTISNNTGPVVASLPYTEANGRNVLAVCDAHMGILNPTAVSPSISAMMKGGMGRSHSPWNHTYMEIETDPVYEEVEKERWCNNGITLSSDIIQVSDLSDEEMKRASPSNVSHQSSRSYSDVKPLLTYYQQRHTNDDHKNKYSLSEERLCDFSGAQVGPKELEELHNAKLSQENLMTVAVLNGEQVVCRLSSPCHATGPHNLPVIHEGSRGTVSLTPACSPTGRGSNGFPAHIIVSKNHLRNSHMYSEC